MRFHNFPGSVFPSCSPPQPRTILVLQVWCECQSARVPVFGVRLQSMNLARRVVSIEYSVVRLQSILACRVVSIEYCVVRLQSIPHAAGRQAGGNFLGVQETPPCGMRVVQESCVYSCV